MEDIYQVSLKTLVEAFNLRVIYAAKNMDSIRIRVPDVARPGIQLVGYFEHFDARRLQVLGNVEMSYLSRLSQQDRLQVFDQLFSYGIPALLIARGMQPHEACLRMAEKHDITLLSAQEPTSAIVSNMVTYLQDALAERITRHGVLMEVYGEGLLLTGESGMGKSETAVELLKRGHRLIADDAVEIRKISATSLIGTAPATIRNFVELRGIGIINVANIFGMGAIKAENQIDLVVNIVPWNSHDSYDRLGMEVQYTELMGVKIPANTIPITPGRNLAIILEVAAMNNRQRKLGYNAAQEFTDQFNQGFGVSP